MGEIRSLYSILGVAVDADAEAIETAYREKCRELARSGSAADELSLLRVAYDTLKNPSLRRRYDARQETLAAEAARVVIVSEGSDEDSSDFVERRRSGPFILLLLVTAGVVYWMFRPLPAPVATPPAAVVSDAPAEVTEDSLAQAPEEPEAGDIPPTSPEGDVQSPLRNPPAEIRQEAMAARIERQRPARVPGFDANYLAWSAYFVVRPGVATGSGVLVAPDKILTNCHVLAGAALSGISVINSMTRMATQVRAYARLDDDDACLLHAPGAGSETLEWGRSADLGFGDATHTFGHPGGSSNLIWSSGAFERRMAVSGRGEEVLITNNYCRPGSSGGPLLDGEGRLIGVVTAVERFVGKARENVYGKCLSVTEATARELLRKPLFPIAMAPATYKKNY